MFCKGVYKLMTSTIDAYSSLYAHDNKNLKLELFISYSHILINHYLRNTNNRESVLSLTTPTPGERH